MTSAAETVDDYLPDDDVVLAARARAADLGCPAVAPSTGATLRFLATAVGARAVVELGTGAGVSGLYLLRGMAGRGEDGVLTSIDIEPEFHRAARTAFSEAGFQAGR
ncbi:MAG: O-methyltransferase, partial [Thermocrispum sp.]